MPTPKELKALADSFDYESWSTKVSAAIAPHYEAIANEQGKRDANKYDLEWDVDDPFVDRWFTSYLGERITQLEETTRDIVRRELQSALEDGKADSLSEFADRLRSVTADSAAFSPSRALMIARTETANAYNAGSALAYRQNGIEHVEVSDGDDDEECAAVDGAVWSVDDALANPTEHPNCTRAFAPVLDEVDDANTED